MTIILKDTPFACRLLEPVDVIVNRFSNGYRDAYVHLKPHEILNNANTGHILAYVTQDDKIKLVSSDSRYHKLHIDTTDAYDSDDFREELTSALTRQSKIFCTARDCWKTITKDLNKRLTDEYFASKLHAVTNVIELVDYGYLKIIDEDTFFDELVHHLSTIDDDILVKSPLFEKIRHQASLKLLSSNVNERNESFFMSWLKRKPIDIVITQKQSPTRKSSIKSSTYAANTNKEMALLIAKHLLINDKTTFVIDIDSARKIGRKSHFTELLPHSEILKITSQPMPRDVADRMNADLKSAWANTLLEDVTLPDYVRAVSEDL